MIKLRGYQRAAVDAIFNDLAEHSSTLVAASVGAGKTLIAATFFQEVMTAFPGARCLSLAHTRELVGQNFKAMINVWPGAPAGINSAALGRRDTRHPIIFASIQSVAKHAAKLGHFDVVLVDECHLLPPSSDSQYRTFLGGLRKTNSDIKLVGLSGTPFRLTTGYLHKGESAMFDSMCCEIGIPELIEKGFLVPPVSLAMKTQFDTAGVKTSGGEYIASALQARVNVDATTRAAVAEMVMIGREQSRRKWIVFCAGIEHSEAVRDEIRTHGVTCEALDGTMAGPERAQLIEAYRHGRVQCLTNVNVLSIGFDDPGIDLLALMRPTKSVGLYIQQVGRGLRCLGRDYAESVKNGKDSCIVLDYAGLVRTLGPIDAPNVPDEKKKVGGEAPVKICEHCQAYNPAAARTCWVCGEEFEIAEPESKVEATASGLALLSKDMPPAPPKPAAPSIHDWLEVDNVTLNQHHKFGDDTATPTLRVTYQCGRKYYNEYVCLWHPPGYARDKADAWWAARKFDFPAPRRDQLAGAMNVTDYFEAIRVKPDGDFTRIWGHKMRGAEGRAAFCRDRDTADEVAKAFIGGWQPIDELADDDIPF